MNSWCRSRQAGNEQQSTGLLHLEWFSSCTSYQSKSTPKGVLFDWCGQQDSNLHALAVEPKSTESTNSTMPAYSFVPLIFTGRGYPRWGVSPNPRFIKTGEPASNLFTFFGDIRLLLFADIAVIQNDSNDIQKHTNRRNKP